MRHLTLGRILGYMFVVPLSIACSLWLAFTMHQLYNWFMLPVFTSLPAVSTLQFVGIIFFTRFMVPSSARFGWSKKLSDDGLANTIYQLFVQILAYALVIGVGYA